MNRRRGAWAIAAACAGAWGAAAAGVDLVTNHVALYAGGECGAPPAESTRSPAVHPAGAEDPVVPGRVLVAFRSGAAGIAGPPGRDVDGCLSFGGGSLGALAHALRVREARSPFRAARESPLAGVSVLEYDAAAPPAQAAALLSRDPAILWAEPDRLRTVHLVPSDASWPFQWGAKIIRADRAWNFVTGDPNVIIAVVDTGLDRTHPDIAPKVWTNPGEIAGNGADDDGNGYVDDVFGYDFVTTPASQAAPYEDVDPPDADPMDTVGHGTAVAGVAAAAANNVKPNSNVAGICWECPIMGLRAGFNSASGPPEVQLSAWIEALLYAAENGAAIVNASFGGGSSSLAEAEAIRYALERGVFVVAAAGNTNSANPVYPAAYPGVFAAAATDPDDLRASFSAYGAWVDLSAPGTGIVAPILNSLYANLSGTSFSSPYVAGAAGLVLSESRGLAPLGVGDRLAAGAVNIDHLQAPAYAGLLGDGRLDAYRAALGARLGVMNVVTDPNAPAQPLTITGLTPDPDAAWLAFPASFPVVLEPGGHVFFEPAADASWASCGVNDATVILETDDPDLPSLPVEVTLRVQCDYDLDGRDCEGLGGDDCDDADATVLPGGLELCDGSEACLGTGGADQDCDGAVDEGCSCLGRPNAPADIRPATGGGVVRISWRDLSNNEKGFRVFRRKPRGRWSRIGTAPEDALFFDDVTAVAGRYYYYAVAAFNKRGASKKTIYPLLVTP